MLIIDLAGNGQFLSLRLLRRLFQPVGGRAMVADHPVRELLYALILALVLRQTARLDFKHIRNRCLVHERLGSQRRLLLPGGAGRSAIGRTIAGRLVRLLLRSCRDRHKRGCRKRDGSYQMGFHGRRLQVGVSWWTVERPAGCADAALPPFRTIVPVLDRSSGQQSESVRRRTVKSRRSGENATLAERPPSARARHNSPHG